MHFLPYWENQDNYFSAWENEYNQTIANMLQSAAFDYIWIENAENDYFVRAACDENYVYMEIMTTIRNSNSCWSSN